jgi:hypothetical protein
MAWAQHAICESAFTETEKIRNDFSAITTRLANCASKAQNGKETLSVLVHRLHATCDGSAD